MDNLLPRRWLAGFVLGALSWAAPALAQSARKAGLTSPAPVERPGAPAPDAAASADRFVALCQAKLQLAPEQSTALHTYLDQEVDYLRVLALRPPTPPDPTGLVPTETQQFGQVMVHLLSPGQLRQYHQLQTTPPAQACLRSMALLPDVPASLAKKNQRRLNEMLAQRLDGEE